MTQGKGVGMGVSNEARSETGLVAQIQMLSGCPPTRGGCGWSTRTRRLNPHTFFPCLVSHHSKHSITASTRSPTAHWTRARTNVAGMRFWRSAQRVGGRTVRVEDLGSGLQSAPIPFLGGGWWEAEDTKSRHSPGLFLAQWRSYGTWRPWAPCLHPLSLCISCCAGPEFADCTLRYTPTDYRPMSPFILHPTIGCYALLHFSPPCCAPLTTVDALSENLLLSVSAPNSLPTAVGRLKLWCPAHQMAP